MPAEKTDNQGENAVSILRYRSYKHSQRNKKPIPRPSLSIRRTWKKPVFREESDREKEVDLNYALGEIAEPAMSLGEKITRVKEYVIDPVCKVDSDLEPYFQ